MDGVSQIKRIDNIHHVVSSDFLMIKKIWNFFVGGNYFMIGGKLDGGRILGKYPGDLTEDGPQILSRGRVIPATSWDSIMNGVAQWVGVEESGDLDYVLPNRGNFGNDLFDKSDLFGGPKESSSASKQSGNIFFSIFVSIFLFGVLLGAELF